MKDYYYILGIKKSATTDEVKKAYRKLSLKFHPDKNDGDDFFTERFKEIQEAYEILIDNSKRRNYDEEMSNTSSHGQNNSGTNFNPEIEYFNTSKQFFEYDEEITFSWKTINADRVSLKPFGLVQPIGKKTYKMKNFKNPNLTFELVAENSTIGRQIKTSLILSNKTYTDLYVHFKEKLRKEQDKRTFKNQSYSNDNSNIKYEDNFSLTNKQIAIISSVGIFIVIVLLLFRQ